MNLTTKLLIGGGAAFLAWKLLKPKKEVDPGAIAISKEIQIRPARVPIQQQMTRIPTPVAKVPMQTQMTSRIPIVTRPAHRPATTGAYAKPGVFGMVNVGRTPVKSPFQLDPRKGKTVAQLNDCY